MLSIVEGERCARGASYHFYHGYKTTAVIILDTIAKCLNLDRGRLIEAKDEDVKKGMEAHADRLTMNAIADNLPARLKKWVNKQGWEGAESGPRKDPKDAVQTLADKWSWCSMYNRGKCGRTRTTILKDSRN